MALNLNRWEVYELLKGNENYNVGQLKQTEKQEIVEGITEYISSKKREG